MYKKLGIFGFTLLILIFVDVKLFAEEKLNLAVAEFEARNISQMDATTISDFLRTELVKSGVFNVVERSNMQKILAEQRFQQTGCVTTECAVQMGRLLAVQRIVIGSVSKLAGIYYISADIVEIESGQIVVAEKAKCTEETELDKVTEELAKMLVSRMRGEEVTPKPPEEIPIKRLFAEAEEIKNLKISVKDFISLTWDSPSGNIQGYDVCRSSSPDILGRKLNRKILSLNKYTDYSASMGKIYYYQVQALDKEKNTLAFSTAVAYISPFYSATIWTPTAFQKKKETGEHLLRTKYLFSRKPLLGFNLDFILNYYIGRLFGKNNPEKQWSEDRYDYITRVGIWLLTGDFKIVFPYFEKRLFSLAGGARYTYMFRDIGQPSPGAAPEFTIKPGKSKGLPATYAVLSKNFGKNVFHFGQLWGKEDELFPYLSEYLYHYYYTTERWQRSKQILFFGIQTRLIPRLNLKIEAIYLSDNPLKPWLFNIDLGKFLPANFQIAYFRYKYGWDILGYFNFRYTFYPPRK